MAKKKKRPTGKKHFSAPVPVEDLAPAGISGDLCFVYSNSKLPNDSQRRLHDSEERDFRVFCVFQRDTGFERQITTHLGPKDGTSFFVVPQGFDQALMDTPYGEYQFSTNSRNEWSGVEYRCRARSPQEARRAFLSGITPVIDQLSYMANTPLIIGSIVCQDEENNIGSIGYTSPYQPVVVNPGVGEIRSEMMPIYALYREAKNAASHFYRFLCYYKILEGIYRRLRPEIFALAREKQIALRQRKETIPDHDELRMFCPEVIGRPVKEYFDTVLTKEFRDRVAHYILDDGALLNPSDIDAQADFANIMLTAELCCRIVIAHQEDYYRQLAVVDQTK